MFDITNTATDKVDFTFHFSLNFLFKFFFISFKNQKMLCMFLDKMLKYRLESKK